MSPTSKRTCSLSVPISKRNQEPPGAEKRIGGGADEMALLTNPYCYYGKVRNLYQLIPLHDKIRQEA
jgi:hypothetical protein